MEIRELRGVTWYRRGRYWYKTPAGSAASYELKTCLNPACTQEFFGVRRLNRVGNPSRFCSHKCSKQRDLNPQWLGDAVGYRAAHKRVEVARGKALACTIPGCIASRRPQVRFHWANLTGNLADVDDYRSMCVFHHRAFDWARVLGMTNEEALERVARIVPEIQRANAADRGMSG